MDGRAGPDRGAGGHARATDARVTPTGIAFLSRLSPLTTFPKREESHMPARRSLLYLAREFPVPVSSAARLRTFNWILRLSRRFDVTFVAGGGRVVDADHLDALRPYCERLVLLADTAASGTVRRLLGVLVARAHYLATGVPSEAWHLQHGEAREALQRLVGEARFDVVMAERWTWGSEALQAAPIAVLDAGGLLAARHAEALGRSPNPLLRLLRRHLSRGYARAEAAVLGQAEVLCAQTPADRRALDAACGRSQAVVLPEGLDTSYFAPRRGAIDAHGIVFFASLDSPAQRDALQHLHRDILPRVHMRVPKAHLTVVASERVPEVEALLHADPTLRFTGPVDDPRTELARATVAAVPLRFGSGSRGRLAQLLSMGVPVVATPAAACGLDVRSGDGLIVAPDGPDFADALSQVLLDSSLREDLCRKGRETAQARLSIAATYDRLAKLLAAGEKRR